MNRIRGGSGAQARPSRGLGEPTATPLRQRPILFSGAMIRALLAGTKTQTRRTVKGVPSWEHYGRDIMDWGLSGIHLGDFGEFEGTGQWCLDVQTDVDKADRRMIHCPYGVPGDLLWVKERLARSPDLWTYVADGAAVGWPARQLLASKRLDYAPSIHMPKVASRLTLEITDVRVERLHDISEEDAKAEGVSNSMDAGGRMFWTVPPSDDFINSARFAYLRLWDAINGDGSAAANPWVWAVSFNVHSANVDQMATEDSSQSGGEPREDAQRRATTNSPTITFPPGGKP
jgi:hypothetical protein